MRIIRKNNCRIHIKENEIIELSKGLWNMEAVNISYADYNQSVKNDFVRFIYTLNDKGEADVIENECLFIDFINYLNQNNYVGLFKGVNKDFQSIGEEYLHESYEKSIVFYTKEFERIINKDEYNKFQRVLISELTEDFSLQISRSIFDFEFHIIKQRFRKRFSNIKHVMIIYNSPNDSILFNLNRLLFELEITSVFSIVDNNLLFSFSVEPLETACYSCFEKRITSRIFNKVNTSEDSTVVQNSNLLSFSEIISFQMVVSISFQEFINQLRGKIGDLYGNIYVFDLITMNQEIEKLYRVPFCEVCG